MKQETTITDGTGMAKETSSTTDQNTPMPEAPNQIQSMDQEKRTIHVFTIGFTKKSAEDFFTKLCGARVKRVIDVRLNNVSQLAGFAKKNDLRYFLKAICQIDYQHLPILAPTQELLDAYKKRKGSWDVYEKDFIKLMTGRKIEDGVPKELLDGACLLCSEDEARHCHRRLVAEYLSRKWNDVVVNITDL